MHVTASASWETQVRCWPWPTPPHSRTRWPRTLPPEETLSGWSDSQREITGTLLPIAEQFERSLVFEAPDLSALSPAQANAWMTAVHPIFPRTLPES